MANVIEHHCLGESHKASGKPCQDYAYAYATEALSMAIVCDGHGGERYFRSQHGAQFATEITANAIKDYVSNMDASYQGKKGRSVFDGAPFTAYRAADATDRQVESAPHKSLMWLFASIISQWNLCVTKHAVEHDLTENERLQVPQNYLDEFLDKRTAGEASFEKTYGCTLMAYVQTPHYWFAFQLGDGKCVSMCEVDGRLDCGQPIPWDERCFLNKTTSLCDFNALEEFRYCYQGNGEFPLAVFLGSDGMDDSYGDGYNLTNFYIQLFKMIIRNGSEKALKELKKSLPIISKLGSKDDMSVAGVYDDTNLQDAFFMLTAYQVEQFKQQLDAVEANMLKLEKKIESSGNYDQLDRSRQIDIDYAKKDLLKAKEKAMKLGYKIRAVKGEETKFKNRLTENGRAIPPAESDTLELAGGDDLSDN